MIELKSLRRIYYSYGTAMIELKSLRRIYHSHGAVTWSKWNCFAEIHSERLKQNNSEIFFWFYKVKLETWFLPTDFGKKIKTIYEIPVWKFTSKVSKELTKLKFYKAKRQIYNVEKKNNHLLTSYISHGLVSPYLENPADFPMASTCLEASVISQRHCSYTKRWQQSVKSAISRKNND